MTNFSDPGVIAAIIALIGVLISAAISTSISRRASYITAVTTERSKWIDKLRENIAALLGNCGAIRAETATTTTTQEAAAHRENTDRLIALITMQLNPGNPIDANMIGLLPLFPNSAEKDKPSYRSLEKAFVRHAQYLLKEEWEKVKDEARGWWAPRLCSISKRHKRETEYKAYCSKSESFVDKIKA
jgi:hypothetical protein